MSQGAYARTIVLLQRELDLEAELDSVQRQLDELRDTGDEGYDLAMAKTLGERLEAFEARLQAKAWA